VITPVIADNVLFVAVNDIAPVPLVPRPIALLLLLHVKEVAVPLKLWLTVDPAHIFWPATEFTVGIGFTVTVTLAAPPVHVILFVNTGVAVITPVIGVAEEVL